MTGEENKTTGHVSPDWILQIGSGFRAAKLLFAASEIGLDADALQVLDTTGRRPLGFPYRLSSDSSPTGAEPVAGDCLPPGSYR